jgi:hypothetical protein
MVELGFILLGGEPSLRQVVDAVLSDPRQDDGEWYRRYVLVREGEGYRGISLHALSAALEGGQWTLDTPLGAFPLSQCDVMSARAVNQRALRKARRPLVVAEEQHKPVALYQGLTMRGSGRPHRAGWWRLVGKRMAEQRRRVAWPDPLPVQFSYAPVVVIEPEETLAELATQLYGMGDEVYLTTRDEQGRWGVCAARELLDHLGREVPDAARSSPWNAQRRPGS